MQKYKHHEYSSAIKDKLAEKRKLRTLWQSNKCPVLKTQLNKVIKALKNLLEAERNQGIKRYLSELSPSAETNYPLWKATKRFKCPQTEFLAIRKQDGRWAKSDEEKAEVFVAHLSKIFESQSREITIDEEKKLLTDTNAPVQMRCRCNAFHS